MRTPIEPDLFRRQILSGNARGWTIRLRRSTTVIERAWLKTHGYAFGGGKWSRADRRSRISKREARRKLRRPYALLPLRHELDDQATKAYERLVLFDADPIGKLLWSRMVLIDGSARPHAVVVMTASELLNLCGPSSLSITMVVPRIPHSDRMRIFGMPGVFGRVTTEHAEGTVVTIATKDIRRCYLERLDAFEAVAVQIAEGDAASDASAKWMDEYRKILEIVREWRGP